MNRMFNGTSRQRGKKVLSLLLILLMLVSLLPAAVFAEEGPGAPIIGEVQETDEGEDPGQELDEEEEKETAEAEILATIENIAVLTGEEEAVTAGNTYTVRVTLANSGEEEAADLSLALYATRGKGDPVLIDKLDADNFTADAETTLDFTWTPQEEGDYTLQAVLTAGGDEIAAAEHNVSVAGMLTGLFPIMMALTGAETPVFDTNLSTEPVVYNVGDAAAALTVSAGVTDGGMVTYQWYSNTVNSTEGGETLIGETEASCTPSTSTAGTAYYYVVATNTVEGKEPVNAASNVATVVVNEGGTVAYTGQAETGDYTISTAAQLAKLAQVVNNGNGTKYVGSTFTLTADIDFEQSDSYGDLEWTGGANWTSIGNGLNIRFGGIFEGGGHSLRNINVDITSGYGGLFGYNVGTIKNVIIASGTIKASTTTLGSIAARNSGIIENCINSASLTSTSTSASANVGGITSVNFRLSFEDSPPRISGCVNHGAIERTAAGGRIGGIVGFANTGNGEDHTIINCYNTALISASTSSLVGGIVGYVDANSSIIYCYNSGGIYAAVSGGGGIYGSNNNKVLTLVNNFFLKTDTVNTNLPSVTNAEGVSEAILKSDATLDALNAQGNAYKEDTENFNNGYPVLRWQTWSGSGSAGPVVIEADKTALAAAIGSAPEEGFYTSGDRWNGREYAGTGGSFWANMQSVLSQAIAINNNPSATQGQVDNETANLTAAIAKLIPKNYVNATLLYEAVQLAGAKEEAGYTAVSWQAMQEELNAANAMLDALYDNGSPTALNVAAYNADGSIDTDNSYQDEVDTRAAALAAAVANLDPPGGELDLEDAWDMYNNIPLLAARFDPAKLEEAKYTPDSWSAFIAARENILAWTAARGEPSGIGEKETQQFRGLYRTFFSACYGLKDKKDTITVSVKFVNGLSPRVGMPISGVNGYFNPALALTGGHTVGDALNAALAETGQPLQAEIPAASSPGYGEAINARARAVFVNGILPASADSARSARYILNAGIENVTNAIELHDGDEIVFAYLYQPIRTIISAGGGYEAYPAKDILEYTRTLQITKDGSPVREITVKEGEAFTLKAEKARAYFERGAYAPVPGITLFVSGRAEADGSFIPAVNRTSVDSGADGSFSYAFYEAGYYTLSVYDLREDNREFGLTAGDIVKIRVLTTDNLQAVKDSLIAELAQAYGAYVEKFYSADDWLTIVRAYAEGVAGINGAATAIEARTAQLAALEIIMEIQDRTVSEYSAKMDGFRSILSRLPDDPSLLGQFNAYLAEEMINRYEALSAYQKDRLTGLEFNKYNALKTVYEAGALPELGPYSLNWRVAADSPAAQAAIEAMLSYVKQDNRDIFFYNFQAKTRTADETTVSTDWRAERAYPDSYIEFLVSLDMGARYLSSDVSGEGWTLLNDTVYSEEPYAHSTGTGSVIAYDIVQGRMALIYGVPYEIKSIEATGVDSIAANWYNYSAPGIGTVWLDDGRKNFIMPYHDVTVTVTWGPVGGGVDISPGDPLAEVKREALAAINNAYAAYKSHEYSDANWLALIEAKNSGLEAVIAATTVEAVETARDAAISAMAAVEKSSYAGITIPSFGNMKGTVDVYIENKTFPGAAFTGVIVSEPGFRFYENDTMMTIILRALAKNGFRWNDSWKTNNEDNFSIAYLAYIYKDINGNYKYDSGEPKLGEFDGDPGSGWMGTLNDWFTNYGFQEFSWANGKITSGDEIRVMYTQNLGVDIGGTWGNSDTSLSRLALSAGTLYPSFKSAINSYTVLLPSGTKSLKVTPTAANKNYLVKTFLNKKVTNNSEDSSYYKRTQYIPVRAGDVIYIGVGEYAWPSMNNQGAEARSYSGTWYELHIITADNGADWVVSLINALPAAKNVFLTDNDKIKNVRNIFNALSSSEQAKVTNEQKLRDCEARIVFLQQIQKVKDLLAAIPPASQVTLAHKDAVMAADAAYKALSDEQKLYITIGDVKNYNAAIEKLTELGAFKSGPKPDPIQGSEKMPAPLIGAVTVMPEVTALNGAASVAISATDITDAIKIAKESGSPAIVIAPVITGAAKKVTVELPKSSLSSIALETDADLIIETPAGSITIPNSLLPTITSQAAGGTIAMSLEAVDKNTLTPAQQAVVGDNPVYDISIMSGVSYITNFGGGSVTISLPYTLKEGEDPGKVAVWYLNDAGELERMNCVYDPATESASFTADHLSYYVVGYDETAAPGNPFSDVKESDWFYEAVLFAVEKGLFKGTSATAFSPNDPMTRAMLVSVLHRLEGSPAAAFAGGFRDVVDISWYGVPVYWAAANGIAAGYGDGLFGAKDNITREQMAAMLYRYAGKKGYNTSAVGDFGAFADRSRISAPEAMQWAVGAGLIRGKGNGILDPAGSAARAEVAAILQRFIQGFVK